MGTISASPSPSATSRACATARALRRVPSRIIPALRGAPPGRTARSRPPRTAPTGRRRRAASAAPWARCRSLFSMPRVTASRRSRSAGVSESQRGSIRRSSAARMRSAWSRSEVIAGTTRSAAIQSRNSAACSATIACARPLSPRRTRDRPCHGGLEAVEVDDRGAVHARRQPGRCRGAPPGRSGAAAGRDADRRRGSHGPGRRSSSPPRRPRPPPPRGRPRRWRCRRSAPPGRPRGRGRGWRPAAARRRARSDWPRPARPPGPRRPPAPRRRSRPPSRSAATSAATDATDAPPDPMAVSWRTRLPASRATWKSRFETGPVAPHSKALA